MSARLEQLLANATEIAEAEAICTDEDVQTIRTLIEAARLLLDMGDALSKRSLLDYEHGFWRTAAIPESKVPPLLARLDALGKDTA